MSRCNSSVKCTIAGHCGSSAGAEAGREGSSLTLGAAGGGKSRAAAFLQARVERDGKFRASAVMVCPPAQPAAGCLGDAACIFRAPSLGNPLAQPSHPELGGLCLLPHSWS